jgi:hypothetical protein
MSELSSPYVFCESIPTGVVTSNPREMIIRAIEQLTQQLHAQGGPWSSSEHRAVAALQSALFYLSTDHG